MDSVISPERGGMWFFRDALGCEQLGVPLLELEPSNSNNQHDHADSDHEEVYLVVDGEVTVEVGGDSLTLGAGEAVCYATEWLAARDEEELQPEPRVQR